MREITKELLEQFRAQAAERPALRTLHAAASKTELNALAYNPAAAAKLNGAFSLELKTRGITWQRSSGRCWMYAVMNILRERVAETCRLEQFELSGNYLAFCDKLEKANSFLEAVIEHADKPLTDRMMAYILEGVADGGSWDMAVDLVNKYGVLPAETMPETWQSNHTAKFLQLLNSLLRKDAMELRRIVAAGGDARAAKEAMLEEVYRMECIAFGEPPRTFDFEYRDQDNVYHSDKGLTGRAFFEKYVGGVLDDYISVTNHPTGNLPMNLLYTYHGKGCMVGCDELALNLTMEELEELTLKQLRDGEPVLFGCDSNACSDRDMGVWDPAAVDYSGLMDGLDFFLPKGERLESHDSCSIHAMIFVGVNFDAEGRPNRWKIENSWGEDAGKKGYFVCSPAWFREYVYDAVIHKKHLTEAQRALLTQTPKRVNPWDSDWG